MIEMSIDPAPPPAPCARSRTSRLAARTVVAVLLCVCAWYGFSWGVWHYHRRAAADQLRRRVFDEALVHLEWSRWAWPSDAETWFLSARTARRAGRFDVAGEWLDRAGERGERPRLVRLELTLLLAKQGQFAEVEDKLHDLLRASRFDFPFIAEVLTDEYMRQYRFRECRALLNRWIEIGDEDGEGYLRRGWVAEHQFDHEQALRDYRVVLQRDPDRDRVRLRVGEILLKLRQPVQALDELSPILRRETVPVEATLLAARCHRERGRLDEAEGLLAALSEDERQTPSVLAERGQVALRQNDWPAAEALLRRACRNLPRDVELLYSLQQALARQGKSAESEEAGRNWRQAEEDARRMSEVMKKLVSDPTNAGLRFECAELFLRNGMIEDAVRWLKLTLDVEPENRKAQEKLAVCHQKKIPHPGTAR